MDISVVEKSIESLIDWIIASDIHEIRKYIEKIRSNNPGFNNRQIAEAIVRNQSLNSGLLGAITGAGGLIALPATIPFDLVKAWKIQAFTIRCIAEVYGYNSDTTDLKTDIFLILSNSSVESIKKFVVAVSLKYLPKIAVQLGGKTLRNYALRSVPNILRGAIWKLGGRNIAEKALQKSMGKAIPVLGAVVGGGMDWFTTQAVGKVAIEYYENSVSKWVSDVLVEPPVEIKIEESEFQH